jgi:hypothetical protein
VRPLRSPEALFLTVFPREHLLADADGCEAVRNANNAQPDRLLHQILYLPRPQVLVVWKVQIQVGGSHTLAGGGPLYLGTLRYKGPATTPPNFARALPLPPQPWAICQCIFADTWGFPPAFGWPPHPIPFKTMRASFSLLRGSFSDVPMTLL